MTRRSRNGATSTRQKEAHRVSSHKLFYPAVFLFFLLLFIMSPVYSGDNLATENGAQFFPSLDFSYWYGKNKVTGERLTNIYLEINHSDLIFIRNDDTYYSDYHIEFYVYNRHGTLVETRSVSDEVSVHTYAETRNSKLQRLFRVPFQLTTGKYRVIIKIADHHSDKQAVFEKEIQVQPVENSNLAISDILLAGLQRTTLLENRTQKANGILPYPAALYGLNQPDLFFYFELYNNESEIPAQAYYSITLQDPQGKEHPVKSSRITLETDCRPVFSQINTCEMAPGAYELKIEVKNILTGSTISRQKTFTVFQHPLDLRFKSYARAVDELSLICSKEEREILLKAPEETREQVLKYFWELRDPTPDTPENELMNEFYARANYAHDHYWMGKPDNGYFTDQGKVFVLYGMPDQILQKSDPFYRIRWQVWQYNHLSLEVVFKDDIGLGTYRLIQPLSLLND